MKKKLNLIIKNNISKFFTNNRVKKNLTNIEKTLKNIETNIDKTENIFFTLSKKYKFNFSYSDLSKYKKFNTVIIIGMGGSLLGSKAIYSFLKHKIKKNFIFFDNIDEKKIYELRKDNKKSKSLFIVISKSGNTIETLINLDLLTKVKRTSVNTILITEKNNSSLIEYSKKNKISVIEHKEYIGGRYSVLSEVGMIPAYLMGLNVKSFRKNILKYFHKRNQNILIDGASKISNIYSSRKISSIVFLNYSINLKDFLYWAQQLIAESLGKKNKGLMPIVSTAPKDHHSLLQLYLDGPKDKIFYIFSSTSSYNFKTSKNYFGTSSKFLKNKYLNNIIFSQKKAFIEILKKKGIPYREIHTNHLNEQTIGELFSYFMLETILIGKQLNINPFNQPAVEEIKLLTKRFLS